MSSEKIKVLIIDDERMVSKMLKGFLEDSGFNVDTASSGKEGLELLKNNSYDAAIVDFQLPDMLGDDLIIGAHELKPEVKYFIHTGSLYYTLPDDLLKIGMDSDSIIQKPVVDLNDFSRAIFKKIKKG